MLIRSDFRKSQPHRITVISTIAMCLELDSLSIYSSKSCHAHRRLISTAIHI
jgi:hypothetical protein